MSPASSNVQHRDHHNQQRHAQTTLSTNHHSSLAHAHRYMLLILLISSVLNFVIVTGIASPEREEALAYATFALLFVLILVLFGSFAVSLIEEALREQLAEQERVMLLFLEASSKKSYNEGDQHHSSREVELASIRAPTQLAAHSSFGIELASIRTAHPA